MISHRYQISSNRINIDITAISKHVFEKSIRQLIMTASALWLSLLSHFACGWILWSCSGQPCIPPLGSWDSQSRPAYITQCVKYVCILQRLVHVLTKGGRVQTYIHFVLPFAALFVMPSKHFDFPFPKAHVPLRVALIWDEDDFQACPRFLLGNLLTNQGSGYVHFYGGLL